MFLENFHGSLDRSERRTDTLILQLLQSSEAESHQPARRENINGKKSGRGRVIQFGVAKSLQRTIERMVDERYRTDRIHRLFNPRRGQVNLVSGGKEPFREHSASRAFEPSTIPYVDELPFRNCRASPPSSSVITLPAIGRLHCTLADQVPQSANRGIHDSIEDSCLSRRLLRQL